MHLGKYIWNPRAKKYALRREEEMSDWLEHKNSCKGGGSPEVIYLWSIILLKLIVNNYFANFSTKAHIFQMFTQ